ncbi:reticulon-4-interacting 1 like mitochondrial [Fusarium heterosporum]|uniref:Reticulon-4-interacting 1 like mitochondrial n=1 Tax=Fusarium heterosporum TaxID=42747 RepID=A0A8H5U121_FUSHE|nr:reticulon-4-interacting 1 like mitochondrial [Fusarium heterosporum]
MKAVQILGDASRPIISINHCMEKPTPSNADILVHVHAAGVTGDELGWPELYQTPTRIPGHEISGRVAALGPKYSGPLIVGQEVFCFLSADSGAGQADFVLCSAQEVAPKPAQLSHAEATALPIPVLTAWEGILNHANLASDSRVLVTGASGAVGRMIVQLVKCLTEAYVIALASTRNHDILRSIGAEEAIDYNRPRWETSIHNVDFVFDTVGGDILAKTWEVVKSDGTIVTVGDPAPAWAFGQQTASEVSKYPGIKHVYFVVAPHLDRLMKASRMLEAGLLKPLPVKVFPFTQTEEAWRYAQQRGRGEKVVIEF